MKILQLQYFLLAAEQKNFTAVAKIAYTSQLNISKQIFELENELGCQLFVRTNTGVELTKSGEYLYSESKPLLAKLNNIIERTSDISEQKNVRISTVEFYDIEMLCPHFIKKLEALDKFNIQLFADKFQDIISRLYINDVDLGIISSNYRIESADIKRMPIYRHNPRVFYSSDYFTDKKTNITIKDFQEATFLVTNSKFLSPRPIEALPFVPHKIITTNSIYAIYTYIKSTIGVAIMADNMMFYNSPGIESLEVESKFKFGLDIIYNQNSFSSELMTVANNVISLLQ